MKKIISMAVAVGAIAISADVGAAQQAEKGEAAAPAQANAPVLTTVSKKMPRSKQAVAEQKRQQAALLAASARRRAAAAKDEKKD